MNHRHAFACGLLWLGLQSLPALAADCIQARPGAVDGTAFRAAPAQSSAELGRLRSPATAPLIAIIPRWYETRTPIGQTAFISKQSSTLVACAAPPAAPDAFELHAIDVGTGLAVLVRGPDFMLLFDAGSNDDLALGNKNRVVAYLRTLTPAVARIDHLLLSHPHRDHVELLPDVVDRYEIRNVWNSGAYNNICSYRRFLKAIKNEPDVNYHTATYDLGNEAIELPKKKCYGANEPKQTLTLQHSERINDMPIALGQNASMRILHADGSKRPSYNENSLVVRLDLGPHRILLMGDAEAGGRRPPSDPASANSIEGKLLACCIDELKADVLVAGHHGSKTSSRTLFLDAVGAKHYIISSGPTRYASVTLPDAEVVSEFEARGDVFRTDLDDDQCEISDDKIGPDNDHRPGGCSNVVMTLPASGPIFGEYR